jgi:flotillin
VRQAELAAQRLEAEVRRPADAEAYRTRTLAEAKRDQTRFAAEAEAYQIRAAAEAQADANKLRAASLREGNQELIAANQFIEILPLLVEAAARGLADAQLTVLNGTQGVTIPETLKHSSAIMNNGALAPASADSGRLS